MKLRKQDGKWVLETESGEEDAELSQLCDLEVWLVSDRDMQNWRKAWANFTEFVGHRQMSQ